MPARCKVGRVSRYRSAYGARISPCDRRQKARPICASDPIGTLWSSTIAFQVASFFSGSGRAESTASARTQESGSGSSWTSCSTSAGSTESISASRVNSAPAQVDVVTGKPAERCDLVVSDGGLSQGAQGDLPAHRVGREPEADVGDLLEQAVAKRVGRPPVGRFDRQRQVGLDQAVDRFIRQDGSHAANEVGGREVAPHEHVPCGRDRDGARHRGGQLGGGFQHGPQRRRIGPY